MSNLSTDLEEADLVDLEEIPQLFVEFQADKLCATLLDAFFVLGASGVGGGRGPTTRGARPVGLVDRCTVVVDMGVQLHVPHPAHGPPLEHLKKGNRIAD